MYNVHDHRSRTEFALQDLNRRKLSPFNFLLEAKGCIMEVIPQTVKCKP
jgi:hypothetical protein